MHKEICDTKRLKRDDGAPKGDRSLVTPSFQEKLLNLSYGNLYPRTNTGGQEENSKVSEITMVKELGKITP